MSSGGFSQDLRQRQSQSLVLAPQLRQSLKILQVAALDLRSVIQEELQSNPTLEEEPMEGMSSEKPEPDNGNSDANGDDTAASAEGTPEQVPDGKGEEMDFSKEFEILGKIDDDWRDYMASAGGAQSTPRRTPSAGSTSLTRWRPRPRSRST
jgi:RNA polymerase sigma-54 factor